MPLPQCYNFAGIPLETKFGWFNGSPGARVVTPVADNLKGFGGTMNQAVQDCDAAMKSIGADWKGSAATAARRSLAATAGRASETEQVTVNGAERLMDYGSSYEHTRAQMAFVDPKQFSPVQKAGDNISEAWQSLWGDGADHVTIGEMNQANDDAANRALRAHETRTTMADARFTLATAEAPAPPPGDPGGPSGGSPGGPLQQSSPPPSLVTAGAVGDPGGRPTAAPPVSPAPASPAAPHGSGPPAVPPPGGAPPVPVPPTGGAGGAGGGAGRGGGGAAAPGGPGSGGNGGGPVRPGPGAPTTSAQAPSPPGGYGPGRQMPGAPGTGATGTGAAPGTGVGNAFGAGPGFGGGPRGGGGPGIGAPTVADPSARRAELGRTFGRDLASTRLAAPGGSGYGGAGGAGSGYGGSGRAGWGGVPASGGAGGGRLGWGSEPGAGRSTGWGGESGGARPGGGGGEPGGRALAGEQRGWARGGVDGAGGRSVGEPGAGGRSGAGPGYGPMMGGAGAGAGQNGQEHRNRYLIPTDEAFAVDLNATPPVLGPLTDDEGDRP